TTAFERSEIEHSPFAARRASELSKRMRRRRESRQLGRATPGGREHAAPQAPQIRQSYAHGHE
ncbi:hypothetical protein ACIA8C_16375, partial [Nocardia sp. NPDC051321]|uniref:hypothetical protein n=1 Tax=Nocardia sp. NPDC051321 TaxID=3364323 RepID=UPI0037888AC1